MIPETWKVVATEVDAYSTPKQPDDPARVRLVGYGPPDPGHCLYEIPADTPIREIVRYFQVGTNGDWYQDGPEAQIIEEVGEFAVRLSEIGSYIPVFADPAGLKLYFTELPDSNELDEAIDDASPSVQGAMEPMVNDGDPSDTLRETKIFHLWWD